MKYVVYGEWYIQMRGLRFSGIDPIKSNTDLISNHLHIIFFIFALHFFSPDDLGRRAHGIAESSINFFFFFGGGFILK